MTLMNELWTFQNFRLAPRCSDSSHQDTARLSTVLMTPLSSMASLTCPLARYKLRKFLNIPNAHPLKCSIGQGLPAPRLAAPQTVLQPHCLRKSHVQVWRLRFVSKPLNLFFPELTGAGTTSTCCPSTAAWPPPSSWPPPPPLSSMSWTTAASPPTRTWSTTGNPGPGDHWPWWLVWHM